MLKAIAAGAAGHRYQCSRPTRERVAAQLKLNELLASNREASNRMTGNESLDEQALTEVATFYVRLAGRAKVAGPQKEAHSIDEQGMPAAGDPKKNPD